MVVKAARNIVTLEGHRNRPRKYARAPAYPWQLPVRVPATSPPLQTRSLHSNPPIAFDARAKLQADLFEGPCPTLSAFFAPCGITRELPCPCNPAVSLRSHSEYINVGREEDRGDR